MNLDECLLLLKDFLTPVSELDKVNLSEISLETIITKINKNFTEKNGSFVTSVVSDEEHDELWRFAVISMAVITALNEAEFETNVNHCYLSIDNEKRLNVLFQLVICFGIHYNLEDNIGIPIEKLSKYGVNITKKRNLIDPCIRNKRLTICLHFLHNLKTNKRAHIDPINTNLYRKYMHELICGLIQVTSSPENLHKSTIFSQWLETDLFNEADGSVLISSLLMAQSSIRQKRIVWFLLTIGKLLTKCLLKPNSVMNVIRAVLNEIDAVADVSLASDWKKCDVIAKIIAQCPKSITIENYVKFLSPQLVDLYLRFDPRYSRHFCRIAGSIYSLFAQRWPKLTCEFLTNELIKPLEFGSNLFKLNLTAKELLVKLEHLNIVYISSTEPSWTTLSQIPLELIHLVFQVYSELITKISATKTRTKCEDLLTFYLRMMPDENKQVEKFLVGLLRCELVTHDTICGNCIRYKRFNMECVNDEESNDEFENGYKKYAVVFGEELSDEVITIDLVEKRSQNIVKLLTKLNDNQIKTNFMLYLFSAIQNCLETKKPEHGNTNSKNDQTFIKLERSIENIENEMNSKIVYFTQLSAIFESIEPDLIIKEHERIIQFSELILEKIITFMGETEAVESESELVHLIFSVVSVFTTGLIDVKESVKRSLKDFIPLLNKFNELSSNKELTTMSEALITNISKMLDIKPRETESEQPEKPASNKPTRVLIEEIDSEYSNCLKDINDPLVPVRAHGLVTLRKLIEKRDEQVMSDCDKVYEISVRNLKFEDSYVYLAAINALIAFADYKPEKVMDVLIGQFQDTNKKLDIENRMKIGEVLTKSIRNYNELVPRYAHILLNCFLVGTQNKEEFIRSSSLSNLGETCKLLNYSLSQHIFEISNCISSILDTDPSIQVQRSAAMVLKMIIEGLRNENFIQILGKAALPLYRSLSKAYKTTEDDVIRLHCQLTLQYLACLVKGSMFPEMSMKKEIII